MSALFLRPLGILQRNITTQIHQNSRSTCSLKSCYMVVQLFSFESPLANARVQLKQAECYDSVMYHAVIVRFVYGSFIFRFIIAVLKFQCPSL